MKREILRSALVIALLVACSALFAQPGGGGGMSGGGPPPPGTGAPIDGGAIAFLAGVVGYVYTQLKPAKK